MRWPLQPLQPPQKKHNSNHLSVHRWIRSAIHASQQLTSPITIASYLWNFRRSLVRGTTGNHGIGVYRKLECITVQSYKPRLRPLKFQENTAVFGAWTYIDWFYPKHLDTTLVLDLRTLFELLLHDFGLSEERQNTCLQRLKRPWKNRKIPQAQKRKIAKTEVEHHVRLKPTYARKHQSE